MWFLSARKARRTPITRSPRGTFRPRLEALEDRCLLSAGALDPTFGNGGLAIGPLLGTIGSTALAVVVQTDGKIVAGGANRNSGTPNFAIERFNANGTLDSSFGTGGVVQTVVGAQQSVIQGLALQSDGKIVAVGYALHSISLVVQEMAVARYNVNGSLDTTFGSGGIVQIWTGGSGFGTGDAVAIQGDGKIDVAADGIGLARINANGSLDRNFGSRQNPGIVVTPAFDGPNALAIQSDGKIILVATVNYAQKYATMAVARYTTKGQLDSSFGSSGIATMAPAGSGATANGVVVQSTGGIVAAGESWPGTSHSYSMTLARLTSTGLLDTTFGGSNTGFAINSSIPSGMAIAQAANGDLVAAGTKPLVPTDDFGVAAFLPSGVPVTTFGTGGTTTADFAGGADRATALAIQGDGKIVAAGLTYPSNTGNPSHFALARFLPPDSKIGSFTASQLTAGSPVTLTASNILNSNPTSYIAQVAFYYVDSSNNVVPLGTVTSTSTQASYSVNTSLAPGSYTLYAVAADSNGVLSDPLAISFTVI